MGNDGGSIPTRRELVRNAARLPTVSELKQTTLENLAHKWSHDPLTSEPLHTPSVPVVSDALGRLFRKDGVIEFLLPAAEEDDEAHHRKEEWKAVIGGSIKSLKDVVEIKFEVDDGNKGQQWICPVTRKVLDERTKAVYLVPCGHAFEEVALKEAMSGSLGDTEEKPRCLQCNEQYATNDAIPILPTNDLDITRLALRTETLLERGLTHSLKKISGSSKKRKTHEPSVQVSADKILLNSTEHSHSRDHDHASAGMGKASGATNGIKGSGIKDASTASLTAKVLEEQDLRNKKRKLQKNEGLDSLFSKKKQEHDSDGKKGRNTDFMTRGYALT